MLEIIKKLPQNAQIKDTDQIGLFRLPLLFYKVKEECVGTRNCRVDLVGALPEEQTDGLYSVK